MPLNRVSATIIQKDIDDIVAMINNIKTKLPFLITLNEDEKSSLPKFGDKSLAFVKKSLELASKNQDFLPRNFNVEEMKKDAALYEALYSIIQPLNILMEKINDTYREIGAEAYTAALVIYNSAKQSGKDIGGLDNVMDELGKRFSRKYSGKETKGS